MTPQDQSKLAGEILMGLSGANDAVGVAAHPGEPPSTKGMNEESARKVTAEYHQKLRAYADYVMSKPSGALTQAEQKFLWTELGKLRRGE